MLNEIINEVVSLVCIALCFGALYGLIVYWIKIEKKISTLEASRYCVDELTAIWKPISEKLYKQFHKKEKINYPLWIGYDFQNEIFVRQWVMDIFKEISSDFEVFNSVFRKLTDNNNTITYKFDIVRKKDSLQDEELNRLIQKQAEKIATEYLQNSTNNNISADLVTAVDLCGDILGIAYAVTSEGVPCIENYKQIRENRICKRNQEFELFEEDWDEHDE